MVPPLVTVKRIEGWSRELDLEHRYAGGVATRRTFGNIPTCYRYQVVRESYSIAAPSRRLDGYRVGMVLLDVGHPDGEGVAFGYLLAALHEGHDASDAGDGLIVSIG